MKLEPLHELILAYIGNTNRPIFMTGKAGTGKTTFLRHIKSTTKKNLAVVAPTAIAAINAGGVTIHSFFQVPFGPIVPRPQKEYPIKEFSGKFFSPEKAKLIKCLDLLIIDEISMVRSDTLDYIDRSLRFVRGNNQPFGGVQLLMIGDLYQLPPVFQNDWHLLGRLYKGPYFFHSLAFRDYPILTFELTKVHRQSDPTFVEILNGIRNGSLSKNQLAQLNELYIENLNDLDLPEHVTLTTHNPLVKEINEERLNQLSGDLYTFKAKITGEFSPEAYPTDETLKIKEDAMVMFIKNDRSGQQQYYNGRTARIQGIIGDSIKVSFLDNGSEFEVTRETWENNKYNLSEDSQSVTQTNAGSFSQFPIRLAWAITIHKSQGLTFNKAVVDVGAAFAHGQTYVALSRCRSMEGLVLKNKIAVENIITDKAVSTFMDQIQNGGLDDDSLRQEIDLLEKQSLTDCFDFIAISNYCQYLQLVFSEILPNQNIVNEKLKLIHDLLAQKILVISQRFISKELNNSNLNDTSQEIHERIQKASSYFLNQLNTLQLQITELHQMADGAPFHPDYFPTVNLLMEQIEVKIKIFQTLIEKVNIKAVDEAMKFVVANYKNLDHWKKVTSPSKEIENPLLYKELLNWRQHTATEKKILDYHIISDIALAEIAAKLPKSLTALAKIKNVGEGKATAYGDSLIKLVKSHLGENDLFG